MRNRRTATPAPRFSHWDLDGRDVSPSRRSSLLTQHLPSLSEGSQESLTKIISPVFKSSEQGRTDIIELVGSPVSHRRGELLAFCMERRKKSQEPTPSLPNLNNRESASKENVQPGSPKGKYNHSTRTYSHPAVSKSSSLPKLCKWDSQSQVNPQDRRHSDEIRRHIQREDMDYDFFSNKAIILERYLNNQSAT